MTKKRVTLALTILMVALLSVGGTLAWLKAQSGPVVNTFAPTSIIATNIILNILFSVIKKLTPNLYIYFIRQIHAI